MPKKDNMTTETTTRLGSDRAVRRHESVLELLPDLDEPTPLVRLNRVLAGSPADTFLKLEWLSPFGSVKDRAARYLIEGLLSRGELGGREVVEASSGNTAIALAAIGALHGIRVTATVPQGVPEEKKIILRMLGAEVWETPDELCPVDHPRDGAIALAKSLAASQARTRYVMANQYENEDNVRAHYETTGPEVWAQTDQRVRVFAAGLGTMGTLTGVGRFLKEHDPGIRVVAVEPQPGHRLPGMKNLEEAKEPGIADWSVIDELVRIDDDPAYEMTKRLWREEALMVGPSTGAVVAAVEKLDLGIDDLVVAISADSGQKYTSYFEEILGDEGRPQI
jgi:cysteine synthase